MLTAGTKLLQAFAMHLGAIAFVASKLISWINPVQFHHHSVTRRLGNNRRGADCRNTIISAYDRLTLNTRIVET